MLPVLDRLSGHLDEYDPGGIVGVYLFGSLVCGGLRPDSDVDIAVITQRSLGQVERRRLVDFLLQHSGRRATIAPGRPLELTFVVLDDVVPWTYPPLCDFLYGEWLRDQFVDGHLPLPYENPDLAVLFTTLRQHSHVLRGPDPAELLDPVPVADLQTAMRDSLGPLLDDLVGDERNVLLTLARMVVTFETGRVVSKEEAGLRVLPGLPGPDRAVLSLALSGYLGEREDDWSARREPARATAMRLADRLSR